MPSYINQFGDWVRDYIVEMGHPSDSRPTLTREITAKCEYLAVESAERTTPGYVAFNVCPAKGRRIAVKELYRTPGPGNLPIEHVRKAKWMYVEDIIAETENGLSVDFANATQVVVDIDEGRIIQLRRYNQLTGIRFTEYYGREAV